MFPVLLVNIFQVLEGCNEVSLEPSLLQAEQAQLPQPFFSKEWCFSPSVFFMALLWTHFSSSTCFLFWGSPRPGHSTADGPSQGQSRCRQSPPSPSCHPSVDAAQDTVGRLGYKHTLLAHMKFVIYQDPQVLLGRMALNVFFSPSVLISGIASAQVQCLVLSLVKSH